MKHFWGALAAGLAIGFAGPATADVKAGVDAWQQGDYARALAEWRPMAQSGDADAQFNLGQAYKLGRGVQADPATAIGWYGKAAAQGHMRAEDNLGLLMFQQGDRANAMPYLQRAANRGEPRAQYIVGTALFNGDLATKDWVRAYALMTRSASSGLPQATSSLEQMDKYVPDNQRKRGLTMAADMERQQAAALASNTPIAPVTVASPARPAPSTLRSAQLPPSTINPPSVQPTPERAVPNRPVPAKPATQATVVKPVTPLPRPAPVTSGSWRIQLGAFGEESRARSLWSSLTGKVNGLSAYQPYLVKGGSVTRLQAGPIGNAGEAARMCGAIKAAGSDCIPKKM